jgi:hypothetical protein
MEIKSLKYISINCNSDKRPLTFLYPPQTFADIVAVGFD